MYGYKCFYRGREIEVYADCSYYAQQKAAEIFKAKKYYEVDVFLCEDSTGDTIIQTITS